MSDHEFTSYSERVYSYFKYFKSLTESWLIRTIEVRKHQSLLGFRISKPVERGNVLHINPSMIGADRDLEIDIWRNNKGDETDPVIEILFFHEDDKEEFTKRRMTLQAFKDLIANTDEYYGDPRFYNNDDNIKRGI